jgi:hypothetical protein
MREARVSRREARVLVVRLVAQVCKVVREGVLPSNDNIEKADYCGTWAAAAAFASKKSRTTTYTVRHSRPPFEIVLVKSGRSPSSIPLRKVSTSMHAAPSTMHRSRSQPYEASIRRAFRYAFRLNAIR